MSISRLLNEFRPLFQILEEPLTRSPTYAARPFRMLDDPLRTAFDGLGTLGVRPPVDVREEGDKYVVDADLPGVRKSNVEVRIGDDGRSITIEGKFAQSPQQDSSGEAQTTDSTVIPLADGPSNQISTERLHSMNAVFTRTIWLPRPIDSQSVKAKLEDGVLVVTAKKAEDKSTTVVHVE